MSYANCIRAITQAAGRELSDAEVMAIYERVHKAALDIKAGRASAADIYAGKKVSAIAPGSADDLVRAAAERAAADLMHEAQVRERQALLQVAALGSRSTDAQSLRASGLAPLDAVEKLIVRDYSGRLNVQSLEQRVAGYTAELGRQLGKTWEALGNDWLGFFQDRNKLLTLVRELRGEDTGDALAKKGAQAFHETAERARVLFNQAGGDVGKLDDWGMPQHHSQERVAAAGRDAWVDSILPMLDRTRYADDSGRAWTDAEVRAFLEKAWMTIATNGHSNTEPGQFSGNGKRANRHAEHRQIHFKDAESVISYWETFGDRTVFDILHGHIESMAKDIAFVEQFGPNPNVTFQTLRDAAVRDATVADPTKTTNIEGRAVKLDNLWNYSAGRITPSANLRVSQIADGIANLNVAGKLGGAVLASFFGDKPMMEAVAHMNNQPMVKRWLTELSLLNPANRADRALLRQQGLMLEGIRSGLTRFYEGLGKTGWTGKLANAVMRVTGMSAINEIRKGAFGLSLMQSIGEQVKAGVDFNALGDSDVRALTTWGITEADWKVWKLAKLDDLGHGNDAVLTPEAISRIPDADIQKALGGQPVQAPPPAAGMTRFYHGGDPTGVTGRLWFTADLRDAQGWASRGSDMKVWYVDVPNGSAGVDWGDPAYGVSMPSRQEFDASIAGNRAPLESFTGVDPASARHNAIIKLLGAVNTESEFAVVTPGWKERAQFYSDLQRGTVKGEIVRSVFQFKSFPWAMLQRSMDAVANADTTVGKAAMTAYIIASTTLAGAMLMQVRDMLAGKDPRSMVDENWMKFWGAAFLQGGALGIYGDFLYGANQTRYGSGPIEALSGPTLGPLLELGLVQPMAAARAAMEGKDSHFLARQMQDLKGFVPGGNIWYAKAALDHLIWQNVMEFLSPGYLSNIRQRTAKEYGQQWYWQPGELMPERAPDLSRAVQ